jgi:hypothetical protein
MVPQSGPSFPVQGGKQEGRVLCERRVVLNSLSCRTSNLYELELNRHSAYSYGNEIWTSETLGPGRQ